MDILYIIAGLALLFVGGEALVRGSVAISKRLGISAVLIGVVVVGFGTSMPELLVSIQASLAGQPSIALGNIVGSNIANIMLILAMAAIITPLACSDPAIRRDVVVVVLASISLLIIDLLLGNTGFLTGLGMLLILMAYIYYSYQKDQANKILIAPAEALHEKEVHEYEGIKTSLPVSLLMTCGGIGILILGADLLVDGATTLARHFGVSEAVIGLSLIAIGTSLPELAAAVIGSIRRQTDVVIGNILGSNLFNVLGILGIASMVKPIPIDGRIASLDIPIMLGIAVITAAIIWLRPSIGRMTGILFLCLYGLYLAWMFQSM